MKRNSRRNKKGQFSVHYLERFAGLLILIGTVGVGTGLGCTMDSLDADVCRTPIFNTIRVYGAGSVAVAKAEVQVEVAENKLDSKAEPPATSTPAPIQSEEKAIETDDMSAYISQAVQEFLPTHKSESLMIMHCLAHRENGHGANRKCGDNGKACGPFQFWQPTWEGYRKLMIKEGVATEIGDRYDQLESARTTAWAIANGRAKAWGPVLRDMNGSDFATCQAPSWYK